ncbi:MULTISPECIES: hypothetical protein [Rhizobium/Agrobacterium group]|uniref:ABM domain-containing protein n=2 Tax=Agrobacterium TaxID=357 RepID=A0A546XJ83_AGRTU|nr:MULTISPECIES: hypothetical protein [Rhizobium/Agrobacterium group]MCZ7472244.1 hypothetical protein [Rhizobium rhizogenes]MCZ7483271.1 hypothetical protein [Rhizobium rhizogenes]MEB3046163.1 hypothetical protein [Rhizobium sp. MJ21]TRB00788.1 hypothetical protein EXN61_24925 [Agrobacterium tumefaciens]WHO11659.1 hypothetical protein KZ699_24950 [Agrobacterium cucumeris]
MTTTSVIEVVTLTIRDGLSIEQFSTLDQTVEREHVALQPGFISRESAPGESGTWLVIVDWAPVADSEASMSSFSYAAAASAFMNAIKPDSMVMTRYGGTLA